VNQFYTDDDIFAVLRVRLFEQFIGLVTCANIVIGTGLPTQIMRLVLKRLVCHQLQTIFNNQVLRKTVCLLHESFLQIFSVLYQLKIVLFWFCVCN